MAEDAREAPEGAAGGRAAGGGHRAAPVPGTWVTGDGEPGDLMRRQDYPLTAACRGCGGKIRLEDLLQPGWEHVPAGGPS